MRKRDEWVSVWYWTFKYVDSLLKVIRVYGRGWYLLSDVTVANCNYSDHIPVVSLRMATTSTWLSPRLSIASRSNCTTSSFSTPLVLKDLVHVTSRPHDRLFWCIGNEKVKPATDSTIYKYCVLKMMCLKLFSKI